MKNTFNTIRQKVNGMFPYVVKTNDQICYLFEVDRNMTLSKILKIKEAFKGMHLIFATANSELIGSINMKDAAGTYFVINRNPVFYYDGKDFFFIGESERGEGYIDLKLTKLKARIFCISDIDELKNLQ